jgi:hypothetical protein
MRSGLKVGLASSSGGTVYTSLAKVLLMTRAEASSLRQDSSFQIQNSRASQSRLLQQSPSRFSFDDDASSDDVERRVRKRLF